MTAAPLRISAERVAMYAAALAALCLVQVRFVVEQNFGDWSAFWAAGSTAGTAQLLDPRLHAAWMHRHHLLATIFPYLPGAAWLLLPFKHLSLGEGYAANFAVMLLCAAGAAAIASRAFGLPRLSAFALAFAWAPLLAAPATGQNSPLALLLATAATAALIAGNETAAGLAAGALLYKWPYAAAFIALFVLRGQYRALAVSALCAAAWYAASVAATGGDWHWPLQYAGALHGYFAADARMNAEKAAGLPALLMRAGVPASAAILAGALLALAALPLLARAPLAQAAPASLLVALAAGPHTLPYDLALMLPAIWYFAARGQEPLRTRIICGIYLLAPLWLLSGVVHFDVLAPLCVGAALCWIAKGYNESKGPGHLRLADSGDRR